MLSGRIDTLHIEIENSANEALKNFEKNLEQVTHQHAKIFFDKFLNNIRKNNLDHDLIKTTIAKYKEKLNTLRSNYNQDLYGSNNFIILEFFVLLQFLNDLSEYKEKLLNIKNFNSNNMEYTKVLKAIAEENNLAFNSTEFISNCIEKHKKITTEFDSLKLEVLNAEKEITKSEVSTTSTLEQLYKDATQGLKNLIIQENRFFGNNQIKKISKEIDKKFKEINDPTNSTRNKIFKLNQFLLENKIVPQWHLGPAVNKQDKHEFKEISNLAILKVNYDNFKNNAVALIKKRDSLYDPNRESSHPIYNTISTFSFDPEKSLEENKVSIRNVKEELSKELNKLIREFNSEEYKKNYNYKYIHSLRGNGHVDVKRTSKVATYELLLDLIKETDQVIDSMGTNEILGRIANDALDQLEIFLIEAKLSDNAITNRAAHQFYKAEIDKIRKLLKSNYKNTELHILMADIRSKLKDERITFNNSTGPGYTNFKENFTECLELLGNLTIYKNLNDKELDTEIRKSQENEKKFSRKKQDFAKFYENSYKEINNALKDELNSRVQVKSKFNPK